MTTSTTARPYGQIATRTSPADRRRTHGQVRAAEKQQWRYDANRDLAALRVVTTR